MRRAPWNLRWRVAPSPTLIREVCQPFSGWVRGGAGVVEAAVLNRSADPGLAQAHILWVVAAVLVVVMVPLVFRVPEHKGSW